ncbi:MAG: GspE/PulE family protein [Patescibacteria group bacterium]|nr:GspE/PulE family protein [Patescibacteria group bacterium]
MDKITGQINISDSDLNKIQKQINNVFEFRKQIEKYLEKNISKFLEIIIGGAISVNASDIHIEPKKEKVKIRMRIDGILQEIGVMEKEKYAKILSRIKLLSGIKLNIVDKPQDGRFSILLGANQSIEVRISALPTEYGESLVLRILNPKSLIEIKDLGLRQDLFEKVQKEVKKTNGMIIVTGPTGSGKTTTLYAFLKKIQKPEIKVITIEDPIEYHIQGISQTQVNKQKGYGFAEGLRSIARQDPDVILVGEIRDAETAKIAIQAALTGHLVLSTLHTNDAAGTIARLKSLGAKESNIGPAMNMVIAQRLVRKICPKCAKMEKISVNDLTKIKKELKKVSKNSKIPKFDKNLKILKPKGCKYCNNMGYKGRIGIYEIILMDNEMQDFILKNSSIVALRDKAIKKGMMTMKQDGFIKVIQGVTTIEEVERVAN